MPHASVQLLATALSMLSPGADRLDVHGPMIPRERFERLTPAHQEIMTELLRARSADEPVPAVCMSFDGDEEMARALADFYAAQGPARFNVGSRWGPTATNPAGSSTPGTNPTVLTWSVVPDSTQVSMLSGGTAPSNLRAYLDGIYGSPDVWLPLIKSVFDRWGALTGVRYVHEPADDMSTVPGSFGQLGVRADIRIGGNTIDGVGSVLAFNFFPGGGGDMVLDTADSFYNVLDANSRRLRNVVAHEHGHGAALFHSCPLNGTKLMEPNATLGIDGPQADEIRAMHFLYGDVNEPDNTQGQARSMGLLGSSATIVLGPPPPPNVPYASLLSLEEDGSVDFHLFTLAAPAEVRVRVDPVGTVYDATSQSCAGVQSSCCTGTIIDSTRAMNLGVELRSNSGAIIASATSAPAGQPEVLSVTLDSAGDYFVRVFEVGVSSGPQSYFFTLSSGGGSAGAGIVPAQPIPESVTPGTPLTLGFEIGDGSGLTQAPRIFIRRGSAGGFQSLPLRQEGGGWVIDTFVGACGETIEFYVEAVRAAGTERFPDSAPGVPASIGVGNTVSVFGTTFQTAPGWTVQNGPTLFDGAWELAAPASSYCGIGDPPTDFDGSGLCFVTDDDPPAGGASCNNDVDGGSTTLISPIIDISVVQRPMLTYARWFNNRISNSLANDPLIVQVSGDGGQTWSQLEQIGPLDESAEPQNAGGWIVPRFALQPMLGGGTQLRVRFIATDIDPGARVEAAIDAFSVSGLSCAGGSACPGDSDRDGRVDFADITSTLLNFGNQYGPGAPGSGDADGNGRVEFADITAALLNFRTLCL